MNIVNMLMRLLLRRSVNMGIRYGSQAMRRRGAASAQKQSSMSSSVPKVSGGAKGAAGAKHADGPKLTPEEREQKRRNRETARRARQAARIARRLMR